MNLISKMWPAAAIAIGAYGLFGPQQKGPAPVYTLIVYGDTRGYLAPCGCTSPMSGGITRAATVVQELRAQNHEQGTFLLTGALVSTAGRQDELKAECYAELAGAMKAAGIAYGNEEADLGPGLELEMRSLSNDAIFQSQLAPGSSTLPKPLVHTDGFTIGSISQRASQLAASIEATSRPEAEAIAELTEQASTNSVSVLCIDGGETEARTLAKTYPALGVIVYRSTTDPPDQLDREGNTFLVTTGYHGKNMVRISFQDRQYVGYGVVNLGPDVPDDPTAAKVFARYLRRVGDQNLLAMLPRIKSNPYAGSQVCRSCHEAAFRTWASSAHSHAYPDLVAKGHGRDPDCVSCHVVGLSSNRGFRDLATTPGLANVGCESCHGPSKLHAENPKRFPLARLTSKVCLSCHTVDNSPGFDFDTYWAKVKH